MRYTNFPAIEEIVKRNSLALALYNLDRLIYYRTIVFSNGKLTLGLSRTPDGNHVIHPLQESNFLDEIYFEEVYERYKKA